MLTALQCRLGRAALRWTIRRLAKETKLSPNTISLFEGGRSEPNPATLNIIRLTFEQAGVEFLNGDQPGVRLVRKGK